MIAILVCIAAFAMTLWASRVSLVAGIITTIGIGYSYGILRANLLSGPAHFIFDASLAALYLTAFTTPLTAQARIHSAQVNKWLLILMAWPALLIFLPFQPFLVSLVGLRGNVFFLPVLALGARLKNDDIKTLFYALGWLNICAFIVALAEYFMGIERFFPYSPVTAIIYASTDAGGSHHRIPSLFPNAHSYAGTMVDTLPCLLGAWLQKHKSTLEKQVIVGGLIAALAGILLASTRMNLIMGVIIVAIALFAGAMNVGKKIIWITFIIVAAYLITTNERFSRFKSLDADTITERVSGSVNRSFFEVLYGYPMGNGLGGGEQAYLIS
jgi:hypothetical protein